MVFDSVVERVLSHGPVTLDGVAISVARWQGGQEPRAPSEIEVRPHEEGEGEMMKDEYHPCTDTIRVTNIRYTGCNHCIG